MKLARHLQRMPGQPPSAREILLELIETGDIQVAADGRAVITFAPTGATLDALMLFDAGAREREDDLVRDVDGDLFGSGCAMGGAR